MSSFNLISLKITFLIWYFWLIIFHLFINNNLYQYIRTEFVANTQCFNFPWTYKWSKIANLSIVLSLANIKSNVMRTVNGIDLSVSLIIWQSSRRKFVKPSPKRLFSLDRACFWSVLPAEIPLPKLVGSSMENGCQTLRDCKWDNTSRSMAMSCLIWIFRAFIPMTVDSTSALLHQRLILLFFT